MEVSKEIVERAQAGDVEAIDIIINEAIPIIHFLSKKKYFGSWEANDCTQYVIERVIGKLHLYDPKKTKFTTWFYKLVKNAIFNYKRDYTQSSAIELDDEAVYTYYSEDSEKKIIDERLSYIEQLVGKEAYEILLLKIGYNQSYNEIGKLLNLPEHKVKRIYTKAYKTIKEQGDKSNE